MRLLGPLIAATTLCACHAWRPVALTPADSITIATNVRVERVDGFVATFPSATIRRDTVIGRYLQDGAPDREIRIPRDSIRRLSVRRTDPGRSIALGVGLYMGLIVVGAGVTVLALLSGLGT